MNVPQTCFLCDLIANVKHLSDQYYVDCSRCGHYLISGTLAATQFPEPSKRFILSGLVRHATEHHRDLELTTITLPKLLENAVYPSDPIAVIDEIVLLVYSRTTSYDKPVELKPDTDYPLVFARNPLELRFLVAKARDLGYLEIIAENLLVRMTLSGWDHAAELKTAKGMHSKIAFLAIQYGDLELDRVYREYFKPAVGETGFRLHRLDESLSAGLIDNQLRVEIINSRFLLADLTNENRGAYWEAGFAEGLGKPVIYLCKKAQSEVVRTHFDTNHSTTVFWEPDSIDKAVLELKATIRATLPNDAIMSDKESAR